MIYNGRAPVTQSQLDELGRRLSAEMAEKMQIPLEIVEAGAKQGELMGRIFRLETLAFALAVALFESHEIGHGAKLDVVNAMELVKEGLDRGTNPK